ncbi:MAG: hypothetical protein KGS72_23365 [Cyanobacteria bacterium REEB67]|nr:hypothetical protein [Cyanobacteria bacterium REEB67]
MTNKRKVISRDDQFRSKKAGRAFAASSTFEEKVEKLIELQRLGYAIASQDGRKSTKPWQISISQTSDDQKHSDLI